MLTKEEFKTSIVDGIKAGRLDPCNEEGFGDSYPDFLPYYWTVEGDQVVEELTFYVYYKFRFGVIVADIENYTEKDFGELSEDEVKQAMLGIIDDYGVDDWYDQYQEA